tara:strand:- start:785 stop:1114 length:330 start_codon:yes stop_codon:yes gene_type:complete
MSDELKNYYKEKSEVYWGLSNLYFDKISKVHSEIGYRDLKLGRPIGTLNGILKLWDNYSRPDHNEILQKFLAEILESLEQMKNDKIDSYQEFIMYSEFLKMKKNEDSKK